MTGICRMHGRYFTVGCTECRTINPPTPELQEETKRFLAASSAIGVAFNHPNIGNECLDDIIKFCLALTPVYDFLSLQPEGSLEYYLLRSRIVIVIKNHIAAYIDGKLEPKD